MTIRSPWAQALQPASFRGIPFVVAQSGYRTGRRVAIHEYPLKDVSWVEDMGLGRQEFTFTGFLVGDDVYTQRNALVKACNTANAGTLIHPSLGSQQASLVSAAFGERVEKGRTVEVQLTFVLSATPTYPNLYPNVLSNTQSTTTTSVFGLNTGALNDFSKALSGVSRALGGVNTALGGALSGVTGAIGALNQGFNAISGVARTVTGFTSGITAAITDASRAVNVVAGLPTSLLSPVYSLGRYAQGNLAPAYSTPLSLVTAGSSVIARVENATQSVIQNSAAAVQNVSFAASNAINFAQGL